MNQQLSTLKALLKCQKINKRRLKNEEKIYRLLERSLRRAEEGRKATGLDTAKMPPQFADGGVSSSQDFKCSKGPLNFKDQVPPSQQLHEVPELSKTSSQPSKDQHSGDRTRCTIELMQHLACRSHQNAVSMQKAVSRVLDHLIAPQIQCPYEYAVLCNAPKVKSNGNDKLITGKKLDHNKQQNEIIDLGRQQNGHSNSKRGKKRPGSELARTNRKLTSTAGGKIVSLLSQSMSSSTLRETETECQTLKSQLPHQGISPMDLPGDVSRQNLNELQQEKSANTPQTQQTKLVPDGLQLIMKRKRGRPSKKHILGQDNATLSVQNTLQPPIEKKQKALPRCHSKAKKPEGGLNDSTRPSSDKQDTEERILLSKEPINSISNESSHASRDITDKHSLQKHSIEGKGFKASINQRDIIEQQGATSISAGTQLIKSEPILGQSSNQTIVRLSLKGILSKNLLDTDAKQTPAPIIEGKQISVTQTDAKKPESKGKLRTKKNFSSSEHPFNKGLLKLTKCPSFKKKKADDSDIDSSKVCISPTISQCSGQKLSDVPQTQHLNGSLTQHQNVISQFVDYQNDHPMKPASYHHMYPSPSYLAGHQVNTLLPDLQFQQQSGMDSLISPHHFGFGRAFQVQNDFSNQIVQSSNNLGNAGQYGQLSPRYDKEQSISR